MSPWSAAPCEGALIGLPHTSNANPFSSRFVRPGNITYRFSGGWDDATIAGRLLQWSAGNFAASIVGPHGTGKSTLLHTLAPHLAAAGFDLVWFTLSQAGRRAEDRRAIVRTIAEMLGPAGRRSNARCIIIDGYEQLGWFSRVLIAARYHWSARNPDRCVSLDRPRDFLLVTAHVAQVGIRTFFRTGWCDNLVEELTSEKLCHLSPDERAAMHHAARQRASLLSNAPEHERNVRDYWFALYDDYERLRRERRSKSTDSGRVTADREWME